MLFKRNKPNTNTPNGSSMLLKRGFSYFSITFSVWVSKHSEIKAVANN